MAFIHNDVKMLLNIDFSGGRHLENVATNVLWGKWQASHYGSKTFHCPLREIHTLGAWFTHSANPQTDAIRMNLGFLGLHGCSTFFPPPPLPPTPSLPISQMALCYSAHNNNQTDPLPASQP